MLEAGSIILQKQLSILIPIFRRHLVYQSTKRKSRTDKLFSSNGFCKHETCVTKVHVTLKTDLTFELTFNGTNVKHQVRIKAARPIRGKQRETEKKSYRIYRDQ